MPIGAAIKSSSLRHWRPVIGYPLNSAQAITLPGPLDGPLVGDKTTYVATEGIFSGGVFSSDIDDGRIGADIELLPEGIRARTPDGREFVIPYHECQLEIGGASGRMVFCRNHDRSLTVFCEDRTFPQSLAQVSGGILAEPLTAKLNERRAAAARGRRIGIVIGLALIALAVAAYFGIRVGARLAVHAVPVNVDRRIGSIAYKSMDMEGPEVHERPIVDAIQVMVDRLSPQAEAHDFRFEVHVIHAPIVNAFALPGGKIVVYTGLMERADTPEQVAGVLAHEMAHVTLRHGLQRISQSLGLAAALNLLLGDTQGLIAAGGELLQLASINSYSREQENAADEVGAFMLHAAGIDPLAMAQFFESLKHHDGQGPGIVSWISTHPDHDDRIANVRRVVAELPGRKYTPLEIDWPKVQQMIRDL